MKKMLLIALSICFVFTISGCTKLSDDQKIDILNESIIAAYQKKDAQALYALVDKDSTQFELKDIEEDFEYTERKGLRVNFEINNIREMMYNESRDKATATVDTVIITTDKDGVVKKNNEQDRYVTYIKHEGEWYIYDLT